MSILTRYVARAFLKNLLLTLLALVALVQVANFFSRIESVFSDWDALVEFLDEALRNTPLIVELTMPMVVLLGAMFTLVGLSRGSELTAMKTSGIGPIRLLVPFALVLVPVCALAYFNQNYLYRALNPAEGPEGEADRHVWRRLGEGLFYFDGIDRPAQAVVEVRAFQFREEPFRLFRLERIGRGERNGGAWKLEDVWRRDIRGVQPQVHRVEILEVKEDAMPNVFRPQIADPRHMPFRQLYREIRRLEKEGARIANYILEWYQKPAAIFALVVMTLLGISLVQSAPRRGRAGLETAMTVLLGVLFWLSSEISFLLGKGEMIPALLAVWGPNLTFLGLAAGVYRRTF